MKTSALCLEAYHELLVILTASLFNHRHSKSLASLGTPRPPDKYPSWAFPFALTLPAPSHPPYFFTSFPSRPFPIFSFLPLITARGLGSAFVCNSQPKICNSVNFFFTHVHKMPIQRATRAPAAPCVCVCVCVLHLCSDSGGPWTLLILPTPLPSQCSTRKSKRPLVLRAVFNRSERIVSHSVDPQQQQPDV